MSHIFKVVRKVQQAMKSSEDYPLEKEVHVDEFEIGTPEKGKPGRSASDKKMRVVLAVEYRDGKAGRAYAKIIKNYSTKSLRPIFDIHIKQDAFIVTDGWKGYAPIRKNFPNMTYRLSNNGGNFKMLHF
jgi:transposase-like protein